mmetsp:Transcript_25154/g.37172  ORF Transcript_25154/g.37172 Transcript_25154/m.37172 type:complete len:606 (-) Transcript_25154:159-1976(-)
MMMSRISQLLKITASRCCQTAKVSPACILRRKNHKFVDPPFQHLRFFATISTPVFDENKDEWGRFDSLESVDPRTLSSLAKMGLTDMTEIQAKTYSLAVAGHDILGQARTGTGKTLAFLLPTLQRIIKLRDERNNEVKNNGRNIQALILSPTRELALQIDSQIEAITVDHDSNFAPHQTVFGGMPKFLDVKKFEECIPSILVATPGRLADHIKNTSIAGITLKELLGKIDVLILDEADRYMDMGDDVEVIMSALPKKRQTLLFSATIPDSVRHFLHQSMHKDFHSVNCISASSQTNKIVDQSHIIVENLVTGTVEIVRHYMDNNKDAKVLVFFPTTAMVAFFSKLFNFGLGSPYVLEIHSKKTQAYRTTVSNRFRELKRGALFTSDVSARGVDYPGVTHVIQIGLPPSKETYIHRLGRTGRASSSGEGILILSETEEAFLHNLDGISVPANKELESLIELTSNETSKVGKKLKSVLKSISEENNELLVKAAEETYRSVIGYYTGALPKIGVKGAANLVLLCNALAQQMCLPRVPSINRKAARNMGLDRVPGIVLDNGGRGSRRGHGGARGGGRKRPPKSKGQYGDWIKERGDYGAWGAAELPHKK